MSKKGDYEVGYGRPPKDTQFQPGESGNPSGRRRGARSFKERLKAELDQIVTITENGREVRISKLDLLFKGAVNAGARGNVSAIKQLFALMETHGLTKEQAFEMDKSDDTLLGLISACQKILDRRGKGHLYKNLPRDYHVQMAHKQIGQR